MSSPFKHFQEFKKLGGLFTEEGREFFVKYSHLIKDGSDKLLTLKIARKRLGNTKGIHKLNRYEK